MIAAAPDWQEEGLCRQVDPELFYPEKGQSSASAKLICSRCPVKDECLRFALDRDEPFGIWGGTSEQDRRKMKGKQSRKRTGPTPRERAAAIVAAGKQECPRCQVVKPLAEFAKDGKMLTGHCPTCKRCRYELEVRKREMRRSGQTPIRAKAVPRRADRQQAACAA
jgi:WhiB family redox-sensing transcriptional regulator